MRGGFDGTVVLFAANPWDGVRMADRQLAERMVEYAPVLYIEPPTTVASRLRKRELRRGPFLRRLTGRLGVLSPEALPGLSRRGVAGINSMLVALQARGAVRVLGGTIRAVVDAEVLMPVMGRCGEEVAVFWAQDDYAGLAPIFGLDEPRLERAAARMARRADIVVAANPVVAQHIEQQGQAAHLVPFGCDAKLFATACTIDPAPEITLPTPRAVFVGHLGERIDLQILAAVAATGLPLLLVGPRHSQADPSLMADILGRPNVQWVGGQPFERLPEFLAGAEVAVLPYTHSRFNLGSFPLKMLEYLAAGLPVVATSLPAVRWLGSSDVHIVDDPQDFAAEVVRLLDCGRDPAGDARRRDFAAEHTWEVRAERFAQLLGLDGCTHG